MSLAGSALPRLPLLAAGALSLVAGVLAGEWRMAWPVPASSFAHLHGPLMVCGFFGTVIALERAVALARPWGFLSPLLTALGGILLIVGAEATGAALLVFGSLVFMAMALWVLKRQREVFTALMALGALAWTAGNAAWFHGADITAVVPLWASFLVLTIAGERLELSRFLPPSIWRTPTLVPPLAAVAAGAVLAGFGAPFAWTLFGIGLMTLCVWSVMNDVARRTVRQSGLTRYVAVCLLSGYVWLGVAGALAPQLDGGLGGYLYDAALHALFVGFVFAMVFGHAPVILPAVLKVRVAYSPVFYLPLATLHGALAARLAGDLLGMDALRAWGGLANALAIILFIATMATAAMRAGRPTSP